MPFSSVVRGSGTVTCLMKFFEEVPDVEICYKSSGAPAGSLEAVNEPPIPLAGRAVLQ